jgi:hypothetical protein
MTDDEKMDAMIRKLAEGYNRPPATPRGELWQRVEAERARRRTSWRGPAGRARVPWVTWAVGLAATLAIGVAIGRMTGGGRIGSTPGVGAAPEGAATGQLPAAYRVAVGDHLSRVETFLSVFTAEVGRGSAATIDIQQPTRQLLQQTRLLRDSPAGQDVGLRTLLDDIELVLVQIAAYGEAGDAQDLGFIEQGIKDRSVLLRLRSALPSRSERMAMGGTL